MSEIGEPTLDRKNYLADAGQAAFEPSNGEPAAK
jgi:hypothetical protein